MKRFLIALLVSAISFSTVACSGESNGRKTTQVTSNTEKTTIETTHKIEEDIKLGSGELETGPNNTILADVFEAFVAAMYLDIGFEKTQEMVLKIMLKYITKGVDFLHDYKSTLQELVQTDKKSVVYEIISEEGPAHNRRFECVVKVDGHILGRGIGSSKKASEQEAAKAALAKQAK